MYRTYTWNDWVGKSLHSLLFPLQQIALRRVIKNMDIAPLALMKYIKAR